MSGVADSTRIDRWLWSVRIFKTRTQAADACKAGHVSINGSKVKPAAAVRAGDRVEARVHQRDRVLLVERVIDSRVGAPIAQECYDDHSPPPPERLDPIDAAFGIRDRGSGRPTKRDRREMERLRGRRRGS